MQSQLCGACSCPDEVVELNAKKTQSPIINSRTWCKYNVDAFTEETYQVYGTAFG